VLIDLLRRSTERNPSKPAIISGSESLSYAELLDLSGRLAAGLESWEIKPGDRVVMLLANSPEFAVSFFAVTGIGARAILLDPHSRAHELAHALNECHPRAIITDERGLARWRDVADKAASPDLALVVGAERGSGIEFRSFAQESRPLAEWASDSDCTATYQYSSGSTGRAKRIGRTHAQWVFEATSLTSAVGHSETDVVLCIVPLFHAYGCSSCLLASITAGATLVVQEHVQPFALRKTDTLRLIDEWGVTVVAGVPYMFDLLSHVTDDASLRTVRYCGSSGGPLPEATFQAFDARFGVPVRQEYGSTEAGKIAVNADPDPRRTWASVGKPLPGIDLVTFDDQGRRLASGEFGRVGIRSPGLTTDHPFKGGLPFAGDFYLTGDLGSLDDDGRLTISGRTKVFIEVLGEKVDPTEVEEVLALHHAVQESVVVGISSTRTGGTVLKAIVVPGGECDERELIHFCKERLSSFKVPSVIEFRESLPRSQIGKLLRKDLLS